MWCPGGGFFFLFPKAAFVSIHNNSSKPFYLSPAGSKITQNWSTISHSFGLLPAPCNRQTDYKNILGIHSRGYALRHWQVFVIIIYTKYLKTWSLMTKETKDKYFVLHQHGIEWGDTDAPIAWFAVSHDGWYNKGNQGQIFCPFLKFKLYLLQFPPAISKKTFKERMAIDTYRLVR